LAATFPEARFVGLDIDARAIAAASGLAGELGLDNVRFLPLDVERGLEALKNERFDYAVAHGVYSWVTERARDALLELFGGVLSEQGVAYVSYNAYPGFHVRELLRDMLRCHVADAASARDAVQRARELSQALLEAPVFDGAASPELLRHELAALAAATDQRLAYDDLYETSGFWLKDVAEHASRHGLRFVCDAASDLELAPYAGRASAVLSELAGDALQSAAYQDLLTLRRFNRSLFCRAERSASPVPEASQLRQLFVACPPRSPLPQGQDLWTLPGTDGRSIALREPTLRAALLRVAQRWPEAMPVDELDPAGGEPGFLGALLRLYEAGAVWLASAPATCVPLVSARPLASVYARACARGDLPIASQYHEQVDVPPRQRRLLALLDGSRDHSALLRELELPDQRGSRGELEQLLRELSQNALLTG
jgi:SAM-dependent methyltransferase